MMCFTPVGIGIVFIASFLNKADCQLKPKVVKMKVLEEIKKHVSKAEFEAILHPERFGNSEEEPSFMKQNVTVLLAQIAASFTTKRPRNRKKEEIGNIPSVNGSEQNENGRLTDGFPLAKEDLSDKRKLGVSKESEMKKKNEEIAQRIKEEYGGEQEPIDMRLVERYRMRKKLAKFVHDPNNFNKGVVPVLNDSFFGVLELGRGRSIPAKMGLGRAIPVLGKSIVNFDAASSRNSAKNIPVREWGDECHPDEGDKADECYSYTVKTYGEGNNSKLLECDHTERICLCLSDEGKKRAEYSFTRKICLLPKTYRCDSTSDCEPLLVCEKARQRDYDLEPAIPPGFPKICKLKLNFTLNFASELRTEYSQCWFSLQVVFVYLASWFLFG